MDSSVFTSTDWEKRFEEMNAIQEQFKDLSPEEVQKMVDQAVEEVRTINKNTDHLRLRVQYTNLVNTSLLCHSNLLISLRKT